jgi:hypothetical protein
MYPIFLKNSITKSGAMAVFIKTIRIINLLAWVLNEKEI